MKRSNSKCLKEKHCMVIRCGISWDKKEYMYVVFCRYRLQMEIAELETIALNKQRRENAMATRLVSKEISVKL